MILLIGPGAVGTTLATYLAAAGRQPLRLLVREKHLPTLQSVPELRVDLPSHRPPLRAPRPELVTTLALEDVDYLFLCVKYPDLDAVLDQLPPLPAGCTVVSTLNGLAALRRLHERLPQATIAPISVMFNGQLLGPLHARITTRPQLLIGSDDPRLLSCFAGSGMQVQRAQGESAAWGKLLINLANAVCAVTHTTFRDLLTQPDLRTVYAAVLDEAVRTLNAAGVRYQLPMPLPLAAYRWLLLHGGPLPWWLAQLRNGLRDGAYPSMVADIDAGRRTEIDQLNGEIVALARAHGADAPLNATLVDLVKAIEGRTPAPALRPAELRQRLELADHAGG